MHRVAIFFSKPIDLSLWREPLERDFEVTLISNEHSLLPLIQSWHPHVLVYADAHIREPILKNISEAVTKLGVALIVIASQYDLREELLAFRYGADHFLLTATPIESLKVRIQALITKYELLARRNRHITHMSVLPQNAKLLQIKDILIFVDQNMIKQNNKIITITPTQMKILSALVQRPGELLTRTWIRQHIFNNSTISPRSIDAQIAKLKKALPALQPYIVGVYGKGYVFHDQTSEVA